MIIVPGIPIVALILENAISLNRAFERIQRVEAKEKDKAPVSEASRKCSGYRNKNVMRASATVRMLLNQLYFI